MKKINSTIFMAVFLTSTSLIFSQDEKELLRLIHADILKREIIGQQVVQKLEGDVKFQQGSTIMNCDEAIQILNMGKAAFIGNVKIFDEEKTLFADTVYFYQNAQKEVAVGHVKVITETDTTIADRMTYYEKEDKLVAEGNVHIANPIDKIIIKGGYSVYNRSEEYGKILQNPILIQLDSLGTETMRIVGNMMESFKGGVRIRVSENVTITQAGIKATCGQAEYFKNDKEIILNQNPKVWQANQQISGDTLLLYLKDSQLHRAQVIGNALAISDADTLNKGRWVNKLTGINMDFYFKDQEIEKVVVENQATSLYHMIEDNLYKGSNEVSGDKIMLFFSQGEVSRVLVESSPDVATGKFKPPRY